MDNILETSEQNRQAFGQILSTDYDYSAKIKKHDVNLSTLKLSESDQPIAIILENIFTPEECQTLMKQAEEDQFSTVSVSYGGKEVVNENVRSGSRVIIDSEEFTEKLWSRISSFIPRKVKGAQVVGLNERLRFLKYNPGQFFAPHTDGNYVRPENHLEMSLLTIQMYLNQEFDGGETTFHMPSLDEQGQHQQRVKVPVKPRTGMALVFGQELLHEGSQVKNGVKYTVRTDVMYRYGYGAGSTH